MINFQTLSQFEEMPVKSGFFSFMLYAVRESLKYRAPVAQLIEHRSVTREVVSSTPVGPTLRVLK